MYTYYSETRNVNDEGNLFIYIIHIALEILLLQYELIAFIRLVSRQ